MYAISFQQGQFNAKMHAWQPDQCVRRTDSGLSIAPVMNKYSYLHELDSWAHWMLASATGFTLNSSSVFLRALSEACYRRPCMPAQAINVNWPRKWQSGKWQLAWGMRHAATSLRNGNGKEMKSDYSCSQCHNYRWLSLHLSDMQRQLNGWGNCKSVK